MHIGMIIIFTSFLDFQFYFPNVLNSKRKNFPSKYHHPINVCQQNILIYTAPRNVNYNNSEKKIVVIIINNNNGSNEKPVACLNRPD